MTSKGAEAHGGGDVVACQMSWRPKGVHEKVWTCRHCKTEVTRDGSSGHPFVRCTAPPSAPDVAMDAWHSAADNAAELRANAPDERYAKRAASVESWIKANRPAPPSAPAAQGGGEVLGYVRRAAIQTLRTDDEVTGVMVHIDPPTDSVPVYLAPPSAPVGVAEAWQEGYRQGVLDERISDANIGIAGFGAKVEPARNNPYTLAQQPSAAPVGVDLDNWARHYSIGPAALEALRNLLTLAQQPAAVDGGKNRDAWRALWLVLRQTGAVAVTHHEIVSADWSMCQVEQTQPDMKGAVRLRATLLAAQPGGSDNDR